MSLAVLTPHAEYYARCFNHLVCNEVQLLMSMVLRKPGAIAQPLPLAVAQPQADCQCHGWGASFLERV